MSDRKLSKPGDVSRDVNSGIELTYAMRPSSVLLSGDAGPLNGNVSPTSVSDYRAFAPAFAATKLRQTAATRR